MIGGGSSGRDDFGQYLSDALIDTSPSPRGSRPPKVWGEVEVEEGDVVVHLSGWRAVFAMTKRLSVPCARVVSIEHDPAPRQHVRAKLRRRGGQSGLFRVGPYHSLAGWSFWSIGLGRNAVVIETDGFRYRHIVIEVAEPEVTVSTVRRAIGHEG